MAYKLDLGVKTVHGTNPQNLIEHIVRERIFSSVYWKEQCFGLNAADLAKRAMDITHIGGTYGGHRKPTPFICLLLKMLMIQPEPEIVDAFVNEKDFRYVRLLGVFYLRLVGSGAEIYKHLERLYPDNRKFKQRQLDGSYTIEYVDDFVDKLLHETRVCDTTLPPLVMRSVLEDRGVLGPRSSLLDAELQESDNEDDETQGGSDSEQKHSRIGRVSTRSPSPRRFTHSPVTSPRTRTERSPVIVQRGARSPDIYNRVAKSPEVSKRSDRSPDIYAPPKSPVNAGSTEYPSRRERSPIVGMTRRGDRSPDDRSSRHRGDRSPDIRSSRRDDRSPDTSTRRVSRDNRSPPRNGRAERSPPDSRYNRSTRSPDAHRAHYRNRSPEHDRYHRRERSPDYKRSRSPEHRRRERSPDAGRYGRDTRYGTDSCESKKRGRYEDEDRYESASKRPKHSSDQGARPSYSKPGSSAQKSGGKSGGLKEMSSEQMNELRASIGLGPLK